MKLREVLFIIGVAAPAIAWIEFADRPTGSNFKRAVGRTLPLL